jgi:tetratricopeptide (TPR) repeat protein
MLASLFRHLFRRLPRAKAPGGPAGPNACVQALQAGDLNAAVRCFRAHLARHPDDANACNNLGVALQRLGNYDEAVDCYDAATRLAPMNADAWYNAGLIHHLRRNLERAEEYYRKALRADASHPEAHRELSMLRLVQGDFSAEVWSSFRDRRRCAGFEPSVSRCPAPVWNGEDLAAKTVLVHGEQGLGDEILFASCYPDLIACSGHCVIETEPRLESLFRRSFGAATVLGRNREAELGAHYPSIAYQVPCGDLPLYFRSSPEAFPGRRAYLIADDGAVERWKRVLAGLGPGPKIGISWRGGTARSNRVLRSVELEKWHPAVRASRGAHFVSLQYGDCEGDLAAARSVLGVDVHHWHEAIADYDETAALVRALDLVITVTTSLAHLAGALGQQVWILANAAPRWCYMASGSTTPWYPAARIFRQSRLAVWDEVMEQVATTLAEGRF